MKKTNLLNSDLSSVIAQMGHTDSLVIGDCGLPIPDDVKRIDLALTHNIPTFIQTLDIVLKELCVEEVIIAEEICLNNKVIYKEIQERFDDFKIRKVSHEHFKQLTKESKAVVRTGECTPYANIILRSGVVF